MLLVASAAKSAVSHSAHNPSSFLHRIWKSIGLTSSDRHQAFAAFSPGRHEHHVNDSTRREKNRENTRPIGYGISSRPRRKAAIVPSHA